MLGKGWYTIFTDVAQSRCQHSRYRSSAGATMIETVIILPLVLVLFFFMIWLGVMSNTQGIFKQSVNNALMLAATRGDDLLMHQDIIPQFQTWTSGPPTGIILRLLTWDNGKPISWNAPASWGSSPRSVMTSITLANARISGQASAPQIQDMPNRYIYTLIYIYQSMRQGIGNALRYPCADVLAGGPDSYLAGSQFAGCLVCQFENPDNSGSRTFTIDPAISAEIKISCYFRPDETILRPLANMIDLASRSTGAGSSPLVLKLTRTIDPAIGIVP